MNIITKVGHVHTASGAAFGGPDSSKWPAWWFDAVTALQQQDVAIHNAMVAAQIAQSKSR